MKYRIRETLLPGTAMMCLAALCVVLVSGCSKDTGETNVKYDPAASAAESQRRAQESLNDPRIPEAQKRMIRARMQQQPALGAAGRTSASAAPKK